MRAGGGGPASLSSSPLTFVTLRDFFNSVADYAVKPSPGNRPNFFPPDDYGVAASAGYAANASGCLVQATMLVLFTAAAWTRIVATGLRCGGFEGRGAEPEGANIKPIPLHAAKLRLFLQGRFAVFMNVKGGELDKREIGRRSEGM